MRNALPDYPFLGSFTSDHEAVDWAVVWLPNGGNMINESYVNLIPTIRAAPMFLDFVWV